MCSVYKGPSPLHPNVYASVTSFPWWMDRTVALPRHLATPPHFDSMILLYLATVPGYGLRLPSSLHAASLKELSASIVLLIKGFSLRGKKPQGEGAMMRDARKRKRASEFGRLKTLGFWDGSISSTRSSRILASTGHQKSDFLMLMGDVYSS